MGRRGSSQAGAGIEGADGLGGWRVGFRKPLELEIILQVGTVVDAVCMADVHADVHG